MNNDSFPVVDCAAFWRDGFTIVRGLFAPEEVEQFRRDSLSLKTTQSDLLSIPALARIVLDRRIVSTARQILDATPVYFGDSSVSLAPSGSGFHKDNTDRDDATAPDWQTSHYPIIRFGVYMQDHSSGPGGLDLLRGSHMLIGPHDGEFASADSRLGDVVVWTLRTSHSANSQIWRWPRNRLSPRSPLWRLRHYLMRKPLQYLLVPPSKARIAAFFSFGANSTFLDRYIAYLQTRDYARALWAHSSLSHTIRAHAKDVGLEIREYIPVHDQ